VQLQRIQYDEGNFDYIIERTRRRTVAIYIDPQRGVVVRAPKRASDREIRGFLLKKAPWILRMLVEVQQRAIEMPSHTYLDGDIFLYLGEPLTLRMALMSEGGATRKSGVNILGQYLVVSLKPGIPSDKVSDILRKWYIARARELLNERVLFYSAELNLMPNKIAIRNQSRRWGSCSSKGNVNLNWKLVMAPSAVLDYVVAHELCHLRYPNHRPEFWRLLVSVMPDYGEQRQWLKKNGHKLGL
jgi:predicted metal-dependent hydrolase